MGKKWRTWKGLLKERAFDKSLTIEEIVAKHCEIDKRVNPDQFKTLVTQWFDPHYEVNATSFWVSNFCAL